MDVDDIFRLHRYLSPAGKVKKAHDWSLTRWSDDSIFSALVDDKVVVSTFL